MIGSHDTFTYLKSTSWVYNNCKKWWKCQCKTIAEQYAFGIRLFDIRVCRDKGRWRMCHGKVNLKMTFDTLRDICADMQRNFPEAIYRLVLEKGDTAPFLGEVLLDGGETLCTRYPKLWRVDIKDTGLWMGSVANNNQRLYNEGYKFALVNTWEAPAHEPHVNLSLSNCLKTDIRKEARKTNSGLPFFQSDSRMFAENAALDEMLNSKDELWLLDYCTNEY